MINIAKSIDKACEDEMYCTWYKCPHCSSTHIGEDFKYCPDCGEKINWID